MGSPLSSALLFLIKTAANLYFMIVLLRFLLQLYKVSFYNPASQWILMATNRILTPLQKIIPKHPRIDFAALLLLGIIKALELSITTLITNGFVPSLFSLMIWPIGEILTQTINFFFFAIIMVALLSWINPSKRNPFGEILTQITEPLLSPARKLIPPAIGIDFSPILVLIGLKLADILFALPITQIGVTLLHGV